MIVQVIVEKRWREVIAIFNFPPTTTSASFVLRKYYLSLLHHFEQVYFFGARGTLVPPAEALQTRSQMCKFDEMARSDSGPAMRRKRAFPPAIIPDRNLVPEYAKDQQLHGSPYVESPSPYGRKRPIVVQSISQIPNGHLSAKSSSLHVEGSPQHSSLATVQRPPFNAKEFEGSYPSAASGKETSPPGSAPPSDGLDNFAASAPIPPTDGSMPSATGGTCNFTVTGTIDGKFDYGYFVTVKIGSQLLHGILYHAHQHQIGSPPSVLNPDQPVSSPVNPVFQNPSPCSFAAATTVNANLSYMPATRSVGRRRRLKNRDPGRPKPNRSAYNFFFAEKHFELKSQCPHMEREYSKKIGESWNKLTHQERLLYEDCARRDKERYRKEMQIYKESFKFLEPKQSERGIDLPKIVVRRDIQDCSDTIEIARSKEMATLEKESRIAEDNKTEKQEITKREAEDYIQRVKFVNPEEIASSTKSAKIEKLEHELGKEVINAAVEIDMMKTDATVVNTEN
ncbi:High mobility group B protein 9 [Dendrobium catenatum]|uniref:High mobility group B protein 9 n=1 Tax=Dendrobium catenatum TaxID=906689 RepID=A0A2I0VQG9_9ASPA|nr:High mobility group B protein 9 [Dendrobium catenatum]